MRIYDAIKRAQYYKHYLDSYEESNILRHLTPTGAKNISSTLAELMEIIRWYDDNQKKLIQALCTKIERRDADDAS